MMRVLHVINIGAMGGAEKLLLQLLPALSKEMRVECLILHRIGDNRAAPEIVRGLMATGIPVHKETYYKLYDPSIPGKIARIISQGSFHLVHSHLKYADTWLAWLRVRRRISVPLVTTVHGYKDEYENEFGFTISKGLRRSFYFRLTKWIYRRFDGFIIISKVVSRFMHESGLLKPTDLQAIIYHGYQAPERVNQPKRYEDGRLNLALPGRLIHRKGQHLAIEAVKELQHRKYKVSLELYGEGPARGSLEQQVRDLGLGDSVNFHGYVADLPSKLGTADMILVPSLWEGFGLVFLDSFSVGTPVITFDLPACNEIVIDGENGLLASPYTGSALADRITELYKAPAFANSLAQNARAALDNRFSMTTMVQAYHSFYKKLATGKTD